MNASEITRPLMIVVDGTRATGKSTLARQIADELSLPSFSKDALKETLYDALVDGHETKASPEMSEKINTLALSTLISIANELVSRNVGIVLEADFRPEVGKDLFAPFMKSATLRQIHCKVQERELENREGQRQQEGDRHPVHVDDLEKVKTQIHAGDFEPIPVPIPLLLVDSTNGFHPPLEEIVTFARTGHPSTD